MKKFFWIAGACITFLVAGNVLVGCVSAERYAQAQAEAAEGEGILDSLAQEIEALKADLKALEESDEPEVAEMAARLGEILQEKNSEFDKWQAIIEKAYGDMQTADGVFDWTQLALGVVSGFVPAAGIGIPVVQRFRNAYEGTVRAVAAGGGPVNPEAARLAMKQTPGLKEMVTKTRVKIGDKKMDAVKT